MAFPVVTQMGPACTHLFALGGLLLVASWPMTRSAGQASEPTQRAGSDQTYQVQRATMPILVDGHADEPAWARAVAEQHFALPWKHTPAPATEFRALWDDGYLYFAFRVQDADVVVLDRLRDEQDVVFEDRVETFLSRDERMQEYFCFEIDPRGRVFDYRASFHRRFDPSWELEGLEIRGTTRPDGYEVEGRIPLTRLSALGLPPIMPGVQIRCGLYRAEFSHDRRRRAAPATESLHTLGRHIEGPPPIEEWVSWVDPGTKEPDFHVPASLGWLEFVE